MPGENYGLAFLQPMEAMQNMEIAAKRAPVELEHMQALTRLNKANAGALELSQQMQASGMKALEGLPFDAKNPVEWLLNAGGRLMASGQHVLGSNLLKEADQMRLHSAQAGWYESRALQAKTDHALAQSNGIYGAFAGITGQSPDDIKYAQDLARENAQRLGMPPEEIEQAVSHATDVYLKEGSLGIQNALTSAMKERDRLTMTFKAREAKRKELADAEKVRHGKAMEEAAQKKLEALLNKGTADGKAGGGVAGKPGKEPAPKLTISEFTKTALAAVEADEVLKNGDIANKRKWQSQLAGKMLEKIEASIRERAISKNPEMKILTRDEALQLALQEVKAGVSREMTLADRALGREASGEAKPAPTKELPADLSNFTPDKNTIYTKGTAKYKYDEARHGLVKVE